MRRLIIKYQLYNYLPHRLKLWVLRKVYRPAPIREEDMEWARREIERSRADVETGRVLPEAEAERILRWR